MMRTRLGALTILVALSAGPPAMAAVEQGLCREIGAAVANPSVTIVPDKLLGDWQEAAACLVDTVELLDLQVTSPETSKQVGQELLKATGALNTMISAAEDSTPPINHIREIDGIPFAKVLAWGARNQDRQVRLATTILLANVVDNNSVCVVLDHLHDQTYLETPAGLSGRVNLLSVVSVIAPWAYEENYQNILRAVQTIRPTVEDNKEMAKTTDLLSSICERLKFQEGLKAANKDVALPDELRACVDYELQWANDKQLTYSPTAPKATIAKACP